MILYTDAFVLLYLLVFVYYLLLFILSKKDPKHRVTNIENWGFVIFIPVHNEEKVIHATLTKALKLPVSAQILVVDDGSTDNTKEILSGFSDDRLHIITRSYPNAKLGKGAALNAAYTYFISNYKKWFPVASADKIIITVLDADGYLDTHLFDYIAGMFESHKEVGGIQIPVTIQNPDTSMLLRMQDLEFVGFCFFVQQARHWFSSLGLGGNGQFIRFSSLTKLGDKPWNSALCEDLDIGVRLLLSGVKLGYCNIGFVHQQGLSRMKPLLKQRTRWVQGHYQAWRYLPSIWKSHLPLHTKIDLSLYLTLIAYAIVIAVNYLLSILVLLGLLNARSIFFDNISTFSPPLARALVLFLSLGSAAFFAITYNKFSNYKIHWASWPTIIVIFCLYGWIWSYTFVVALTRMLKGQNNWVKTERSIPI